MRCKTCGRYGRQRLYGIGADPLLLVRPQTTQRDATAGSLTVTATAIYAAFNVPYFDPSFQVRPLYDDT